MIKSSSGKDKVVYGIPTSKYIRPEQISEKINQKLRHEKDEDVQLWDDLLKKQRHEMPGASEERLKAIVYRKI